MSVAKKLKTESSLDRLKDLTVVVADTGDFNTIQKFSPQDATTNPSLILKAAAMSDYASIIDDAITFYKKNTKISDDDRMGYIIDRISASFGVEISKIVPGYVSTEVDARLSFDTDATVKRARRIISMYKEMGVDKSRVLIKIASTYEGIMAGKILEAEGITCNLTLLFSLVQAAACAEAKITLISPFVGRILDWYKKKTGDTYSSETDPGVLSVKKIFAYYKKFGYNTIVMGASFRNIGEILALAGCDRLTIAPALLDELKNSSDNVEKKLKAESAAIEYPDDKIPTDESNFRFALNEDAMATEKLSEGIRAFSADLVKLENLIKEKLE